MISSLAIGADRPGPSFAVATVPEQKVEAIPKGSEGMTCRERTSMMTDDEMIAEHDRNVKMVAEAVFGLVDRFAPRGMTPVAVFEGALKGAVVAMMVRQGDDADEIAELLEGAADAVRRMEPEAWRATRN
jgi:hypothetical protein